MPDIGPGEHTGRKLHLLQLLDQLLGFRIGMLIICVLLSHLQDFQRKRSRLFRPLPAKLKVLLPQLFRVPGQSPGGIPHLRAVQTLLLIIHLDIVGRTVLLLRRHLVNIFLRIYRFLLTRVKYDLLLLSFLH